jgi:hypothetical protein
MSDSTFDIKLKERSDKLDQLKIKLEPLLEEYQAYMKETTEWLSKELVLDGEVPHYKLIQKAREKQ